MRIWIALIVAPLAALTDQTVAFALVHFACEQQSAGAVHLAHAVFLTIAATAAAGAWMQWRETAMSASTGDGAVQPHFLAGVAMMVAALSAAAIIAMWIPTWIVSPCFA